MPARVTLYSRPGCHLCDEARTTVAAVCEALDVTWTEVDIDTSPELTERHGEQIPVVVADGATVGFWRIDPERLRSALA